MAELLIKAVDATHTDPTKDVLGCYKRGDVVLVRPNGWTWGTKEVLPPADGGKFVRVVISDVTPEQVRNWIRNNWQTELESDDGTRRRRVHINWAALPNNVRNALNNNGVYTNTWANIRQYVRNKLTAQTATGATI